jgi:amino-acid N-acetyltransferase
VDIVPARAIDEVAIRRMLVSAQLPTEDISPKSLEHFLVMRDGDAIVGVVGLDLDGDFALLRSLAFVDGMRSRGVGDQLVNAAEALAARCAVRDIYLLTTTADKYFAARGYSASSCSSVPAALQQMPQFKSLCPSTSVLMTKRL